MVAAAPPSARQRKRGQDIVHDFLIPPIRACCIDPTCSELECPLAVCASERLGRKVDTRRNDRIKARHSVGDPISDIARDEALSERQVFRILALP